MRILSASFISPYFRRDGSGLCIIESGLVPCTSFRCAFFCSPNELWLEGLDMIGHELPRSQEIAAELHSPPKPHPTFSVLSLYISSHFFPLLELDGLFFTLSAPWSSLSMAIMSSCKLKTADCPTWSLQDDSRNTLWQCRSTETCAEVANNDIAGIGVSIRSVFERQTTDSQHQILAAFVVTSSLTFMVARTIHKSA